jgi:hypothetical protein
VIAFGYKLQPRQCKDLIAHLSEFYQPIWQQHFVIFKTAQENMKLLIIQIFRFENGTRKHKTISIQILRLYFRRRMSINEQDQGNNTSLNIPLASLTSNSVDNQTYKETTRS